MIDAAQLHRESIIIDGLVVSEWSREVFEALHAGGLTAINATVAVWEHCRDTMDNIAAMLKLLDECGDLAVQVRTAADILAAKQAGKVEDDDRREARQSANLTQEQKEDIEEVRVLRRDGVLIGQQPLAFGCLANPREIDIAVVHTPDEAGEVIARIGHLQRPQVGQCGQGHHHDGQPQHD